VTIDYPLRVLELRSVWGTGGGPEKTILLGAARSDPMKYRITVCYVRDARDNVFGPKDKYCGSEIDYAEVREKHSLDPRVWPKLHRLVKDRGIDIVHAHDYKTDVLALLLSWSAGVIPLSTAHGWTGNSRRESAYYYFDKKLLRRFPRVIAVSSEIRQQLVRYGSNPEKVKVVLNGIDPKAFVRVRSRESEARAALGLPMDGVVIGAVGRLERQKRFDLLIEAFGSLRKDHSNLVLAIAGEGSLRNDLEEQIMKMGLSGCCRLLGHQKDVPFVHHAVDLFVQSSEYEGTPNAVLEAMALETPIVATDVGGTAELVRDDLDGIIIPRNDPHAIFDAIRKTISDWSAAEERVKSARMRIENQLSFDQRMRHVELIYEELIKQYPRQSNRQVFCERVS
jgi:glycosyltransferase involved in cell wall biosynthesis